MAPIYMGAFLLTNNLNKKPEVSRNSITRTLRFFSFIYIKEKQMVYSKKSKELAEELAGMLTHNKYLLDDPETLVIALECRFINCLGDAFREGRESVVLRDMSHLGLDVKPGSN